MSDEQNKPPEGQGTPEAWREVGKQFETLGRTLAEAVRTSWYSEDNRRRLQEMQGGLESMVRQVGTAIKDSTSSPGAQQAKSQAMKTASEVRTAGEQTVQEITPHVVTALHRLNEELQKLVSRLEAEKPGNKPNEPPPGGPTA